MSLLIISLLTGVFIIVMGFLSRRYPALIAKYNELDEHKKREIPGILLRSSLITGLFIIGGCLASYLLRWELGILIFLTLPLLIMSLYLLFRINDTSKRSTKVRIGLFVLITVFVFGIVITSSATPVVTVDRDNIKISGSYGESIPIAAITSLELSDTLPAIKYKSNGYSLGGVRKGYFVVEGMGKVKLFTQTSDGPYIHLRTDSRQYLINLKEKEETVEVYSRIKEAVNRK